MRAYRESKRIALGTEAKLRVLMAGYVGGGVASPFKPVWNRSRFQAVKRRVSIPVLAVGGIRTRDEVHENQACGRSGNSGRLGHRGMVARPAEAQKPEAKPGEAGLAAGDPMRRGHAKPVRAARK